MPDTNCHMKPRNRSWARFILFGGAVGTLLVAPGLALGQVSQWPNSGTPITTATMPTMSTPVSNPQTVTQDQVRLQVYNVPLPMVGPVGAQLQIHFHDDPTFRVTTEPKTGQLLIMATDSAHQRVGQQINQLLAQTNVAAPQQSQLAAGQLTEHSYQLRNLSWRELEDALTSLAGQRATLTTERNGEVANLTIAGDHGMRDIVQVDRRTSQVTLQGQGASLAGWTRVVQTLDQGQGNASAATHVVPLGPAEPRKVKQAFQLVKATLMQEQGGAAEAQVTVDGQAQATAMGSLEDLGTGSGLFGDVQIEFIEEIDLVIIRGSKDDVKRTLEVIDKIKKQAAETQPEVVVHVMKHANGDAVATLVTQLYDSIYLPRQGAVSITALGQPNALLLIGRKEVVVSVQELIEKIDQPLDPQHQLKVRRMLHASAVDIEERIQLFFVEQPGSNDAVRTGLGTRVKIVSDYRTNSLIIQASPREMLEVEKLISELDVESTEAESELRVFRLKNTLAEDLQAVIEEVITGQGAGGDTSLASPPSGKLSIVTVDGNNTTKVESGILAGVVISADASVNAIVVKAPGPSMALIAKLIEELDQLPSAEARIKVFQLRNGDATTLAQTLQGLFGLAITAGQGAQGSFLNNLSQSNLTTGGGEGSLVQLQIAAEARTNSVIVSGSRSDLEVLEALVLRLDEDVAESRRTEVIWLNNATAEFVATALSDYFTQLTQAQQNLNNGINQILSAQELVNRQVFVVPEQRTNSILLSASPEYFDAALGLIERLDRRPPMIAIQVLIAEVQLDDSLELGAEWGLQDGLLFDRGSATGGSLSSPVFGLGNAITSATTGGLTQNVAGQAMSSFGVGRNNSAGTGGLVLSASSEAVGVLVRALQTANRIQILNRPQLTTMDQQLATAQVGSSVPRVTGVTQANGISPQQTLTTDEDVGLLLSVLPRVGPDGIILMQVGIENSSVGDPSTGIPIGFGVNGEVIRSPIINRTRADTVVSAYSGQTVVFAGLISKSRSTARSQIPILGSIPWIGAAFRFDVESEQRRELMVVLTPRLIQTDEDYETLKTVETSRMSWCLADVLNLHGDVGMSGGNGLWGPAKSTMIYPDGVPTALQDRALHPNVGTTDPNQLQEYQLDGTQGIIEPAPAPTIDMGASNGKPVFQQAGYIQPLVPPPGNFAPQVYTPNAPGTATYQPVPAGGYK
ncbi:secretin N-terminal domain-containing protein [Aureliella helgolandensis]|uniref:Type II secretion system protein D n=1 Tax=Aureliella helgolandensis TaxID=2527968 RepID=A0A518GDH1_9BACT|nr:secretin N-terminal domain-containing protein [Aureliella helgolandensis]QDV26649.1 Putative type II secretion system protein D precursor [Aureliella helgolandensis]